jgi:hypothetical protein
MSLVRSLILTLIGLAFTAGSLFVAFNPESPDLRLGLGCAAFFGGCTLVGASSLFVSKPPQPEPDGSTLIRGSPARSLAFALAALGFAVGATFAPQMWAEGDKVRAVIVALCGPFGLLGAVVFAMQALSSKPLYRLDRHGIIAFTPRQWEMPWTAIDHFETVQVRGTRMLTIHALPEIHPRKAMFGVATVTTGASGLRFETLSGLVISYWERNRGKR